MQCIHKRLVVVGALGGNVFDFCFLGLLLGGGDCLCLGVDDFAMVLALVVGCWLLIVDC